MHLPLRETAEAAPLSPPSSSSSPSSAPLCEWSLSPVANCHSAHLPGNKSGAVNPSRRRSCSPPLRHHTSEREAKGGVSLRDARTLPRASSPPRRLHPSIHPSHRMPPPSVPAPACIADCRISLYIRFSSFMILHKLIQLDNQREKLTHVS